MRRLLIVLLVVVLLLLAGDFGFKAYAESKFASNIQQGMGLEDKPGLSLGGFPFTLAMTRGELPSARVEADGVMNEGLRVERVEIDLRTVTFDTGAVLAGRANTIRAASGEGEATVTAEDMTAYLNMQGYAGRIAFGANVATVDTSILGVVVTAKGPLRITEGSLVFEPTEANAGGVEIPLQDVGFTFELPRPFEGFRYTGIEVVEGRATLQIELQNAVIQIQPQPAQ